MSFQSTLEIDSKTFVVEYYRSKFKQAEQLNGKPAPEVRGGDIWLIMEGSDDDTFSSWMSDATANKSGTINLYSYDQEEQVFKKIEFSGAYITHFMEWYATEKDNGNSDKSFITNFIAVDSLDRQMVKIQKSTGKNHLIAAVISAEKICIDGVNHINDWWT